MNAPGDGSTSAGEAAAASERGTAEPSGLEAAVRAIWERRRDHVVQRIAAIERAAAALDAAALDEPLRLEAHGEAHKLAGSAGSFGFAAASDMAREAERMLVPGGCEGAGDAARLHELAAGLRRELGGPVPGTP